MTRRYWWAFALRGAIAIVLGAVVALQPQISLLLALVIVAAYAFADGVVAVVLGIACIGIGERHWRAFILEGIAGIALGLCVLYFPHTTGTVLMYLVGAWALVSGVIEIVMALQTRNQPGLRWRLLLAGAASIALGGLIYDEPMLGATVIAFSIAAYAIIFGILQLITAFRLRATEHAAAQ